MNVNKTIPETNITKNLTMFSINLISGKVIIHYQGNNADIVDLSQVLSTLSVDDKLGVKRLVKNSIKIANNVEDSAIDGEII